MGRDRDDLCLFDITVQACPDAYLIQLRIAISMNIGATFASRSVKSMESTWSWAEWNKTQAGSAKIHQVQLDLNGMEPESTKISPEFEHSHSDVTQIQIWNIHDYTRID